MASEKFSDWKKIDLKIFIFHTFSMKFFGKNSKIFRRFFLKIFIEKCMKNKKIEIEKFSIWKIFGCQLEDVLVFFVFYRIFWSFFKNHCFDETVMLSTLVEWNTARIDTITANVYLAPTCDSTSTNNPPTTMSSRILPTWSRKIKAGQWRSAKG